MQVPYSYDKVGDLIETIDRNGRTRTYDYDELYRQTAEHWLDTNHTDIRTITYSYDAVGHLIDSNDPDSHYTYTYDLADRITSVDNLGTTGVPRVLLDYSYDNAGNLLNVTDTINGILTGITAYTYDNLNRATQITQSGTGVQNKRIDLTYNRVNQLTGLTRYGNLTGTAAVADTSYTYDLAGRLQSLTHKHGDSTLASYGLVYDNANRIIQSAGTDGVQDYTYDSTNQLATASHTTIADEAYSYDANGNRTGGGSRTGTNNQLLTDGTYTYEYDGEGNGTKRTEIGTGKVTEYKWDYRNRLTGVTFKDAGGTVTKTIEYSYDVNDRRIGKKIDGVVTERYVYDGSNIDLVFDGAGVQTHRYLYGIGVDQVLASERGGTVVWALSDNQGTVRDLVDGNGTILNHVSYDSFGRVVSQSDANVEFRFGYTGREQDNETGLDYYRARYYDASNGRFISEDPIGFSAGDGNLTRYVRNNPTNWVDPFGEQSRPTAENVNQRMQYGGGYKGGGQPSGNGYGASDLRGSSGSSGSVGGGNFRPAVTNPTVGNYGQTRGLIQNSSGGLPASDPSHQSQQQPETQPTTAPQNEAYPITPDPNCGEEKKRRKKECKGKNNKPGRILYRGSGRSPSENGAFVNGFQSKGTMKILQKHVDENPKDSAFISTSTEHYVGVRFATNYKFAEGRGTRKDINGNDKNGYLYTICDPGNGQDAQKVYDAFAKANRRQHKYAYQKEIAFEKSIPAKYIISVQEYNNDQKYIKNSTRFNPNYNPN